MDSMMEAAQSREQSFSALKEESARGQATNNSSAAGHSCLSAMLDPIPCNSVVLPSVGSSDSKPENPQ